MYSATLAVLLYVAFLITGITGYHGLLIVWMAFQGIVGFVLTLGFVVMSVDTPNDLLFYRAKLWKYKAGCYAWFAAAMFYAWFAAYGFAATAFFLFLLCGILSIALINAKEKQDA